MTIRKMETSPGHSLNLSQCLCMQQLPKASLHCAEKRREAAQLHQELQHQFELLNSTLLRQMGLHYSMLPTGMLGLEGGEIRTLQGKQLQGYSTIHQKHGSPSNDMEKSQTTMSSPLRRGELPSEGSTEKAFDWLPYCEDSRPPRKGPEGIICSSYSMIDEQMEGQNCALSGGRDGTASDFTPPLSSLHCQQHHEGHAAREASQANKVIPCITSLKLNNSEDGSSTLQSVDRSGTESQACLQQPGGKVRQTCCLRQFCFVARQAWPAKAPPFLSIHSTEKKIPIAHIMKPGSLSRRPGASKATDDHHPTRRSPTLSSALDAGTAYPTISHDTSEHTREGQWKPATIQVQPQRLHPFSAPSQIQQKVPGSSYQLFLPTQAVTAESEPVHQLLQQQWIGQWQQRPQEWNCVQQFSLQRARMQHIPTTQQFRQRRSYGFFSYTHPILPQNATVPWVTVVTIAPHLRSYWEGTNRAEELFVGGRGAPLPSMKRPVTSVNALLSGYSKPPYTTEVRLL